MCITTLVSRYRRTYGRVYVGSVIGKRRVQEGSVAMAGGQRGYGRMP